MAMFIDVINHEVDVIIIRASL